MIAALLTSLRVPRWFAVTALCILSGAAALAYRAHLIEVGVAQESARRDAIDAENDRRAKAQLAQLNARVTAAQNKLDATLTDLSHLRTELSHEQAKSAALQSDLAAGRRRMSVAVTGTCTPAHSGQGEGAGPAGLDPPGGGSTVDLQPRVASDLEWLRQTRDDALTGLRACIAAYGAVKTAADAQ
jgi:hypothetical protein